MLFSKELQQTTYSTTETLQMFLSREMCLAKLSLLPGTDATLIRKLESFIAVSVYTSQRVFVQCG